MSDYIKPCVYSGRHLENQWINTIFQSHDLFCGCLQPLKHLENIKKREKWLHTTDTGTGTDDHGTTTVPEDTGFDPGDLEKLFEEKEDTDG